MVEVERLREVEREIVCVCVFVRIGSKRNGVKNKTKVLRYIPPSWRLLPLSLKQQWVQMPSLPR